MADENKIRERAYAIWEREGRPHGRHDDHWHQASTEQEDGSAGLSVDLDGGAIQPDGEPAAAPAQEGRSAGNGSDSQSGGISSAGGGQTAGQDTASSSGGLATGLQPGGITPGSSPAAGMGSMGTGGGSTGNNATGSAAKQRK
jgi:hypothetical protein